MGENVAYEMASVMQQAITCTIVDPELRRNRSSQRYSAYSVGWLVGWLIHDIVYEISNNYMVNYCVP